MLTVRLFCEAEVAELYDPAIQWANYPFIYLRAYKRCKDFKSKIPLLVDLKWEVRDMRFLMYDMPLDIVVIFLEEFNKYPGFFSQLHLFVDYDRWVLRTFDSVKLLHLLTHGFPLKYINWYNVPFDHPTLTHVLAPFIKTGYLPAENKHELEYFAKSVVKKLDNIYIDVNNEDNLIDDDYCKLQDNLDRYFIAVCLGFLGDEYPIFRSREFKLVGSKLYNSPRIISFTTIIAQISLETIVQLLERDWILDPISFIHGHLAGFKNMDLFVGLNVIKKFNLMYVFEEQIESTKLAIRKYIRGGKPRRYEPDLDLRVYEDVAGCEVASANDKKVNPAKYALWRKYRERFFN